MWLEHLGKPLIGKGGAQILEQIEKEHSISKAAKKLGMSYRYVWSYIKRVERTLEKPIVET
ncbi:MAG: winged helix-turn-helix domain-containing protein, partial [Candidatus Norongarragalinales archaeon]